MLFLDFLVLLFALYLATQVFIPLLFPRDFKINWLFKKKNIKGSIYEKVDTLSAKADEIKNIASDILTETDAELQKAKETNAAVKKLTK